MIWLLTALVCAPIGSDGSCRRTVTTHDTRSACIAEERRLKRDEPLLRRARCRHSLPMAQTE